MLAILFLLSGMALGTTLAYAIPTRLRFEERIFMGVPIGLAVLTLATFAISLVTGVGSWPIAAVTGAGGLAAGVLWRQPALRKRLAEEAADLHRRSRTRRFRLGAVVYGAFALLLIFLFWQSLTVQNGTIYAGSLNIWGDWSWHFPQVTNFAYGDNLPPEFPVMDGQRLSYPFLTNFLSATLVAGGLGLLAAFKVPSILLALAGLGMLMTFTRYLAGGAAAALAPALFYLAGGFGFVEFFADLFRADNVGMFLAKLPQEYTRTFDGLLPNINWINPVVAYVVPQRAFLFGFPLALAVLTLVHQAIQTRRRDLMLAAGLIVAIMPLVHVHSIIFLGMITPVVIALTFRQVGGRLRGRKRATYVAGFWGLFAAPVALLALPQAAWLTHGLDGGQFFRFQFGWTKGPDNIAWFWLKNAGLFIPLLVAGLVWLYRRHQASTLVAFAAGGAFVFILANVFVFQPWDWDNSKFLVYWLVVSVPVVAWVLVQLTQRGMLWRIGVVGIVLSLTLAGAADVYRISQSSARLEMFTLADQEIAQTVRAEAKQDAVFLTAQNVNNTYSALAGRRIVMGYGGWLWSWGLPYQQREADVARMFEGAPGTVELLEQYNVDYVVFGPSERAQKNYGANEQFFSSRFAVWQRFGNTTVYEVGQPVVSR